MIIVNNESFSTLCKDINSAPNISIDTETTGLHPYLGDKLFGISISTEENDYYLDFKTYLKRSSIKSIIDPDYNGRIFYHNAKFDMKMLENEGLNLRDKRLYDVAGLARLEYNDRLQLRLATLAKILKLEKIDEVKEYIKKNKCYKINARTGKKEPDFTQVPFELISRYAIMDSHLTLKLGMHFLQELANQDMQNGNKGSNLLNVMRTENTLTPILMKMQDRGLRIDSKYCKEGFEHGKESYTKLAKRYKEITGIPFIDSNKNHSLAFQAIGEKYPLTEKGNPCFNKEALSSMDSELSNVIKEYRYEYKKTHTYFENFLNLRDKNDIIHASLNQYQARTGRFSSSEPNLQNLNRGQEGEKYAVRGAFISHIGSSNFYLDYDQFEYRMMLNKAGEMRMIEQILEEGLDVHTATANLMGVPRQQAKTINFLLLYGGGIAVLARNLFVTHLSEHTLKEIQKLKFFREFLWSNTAIEDHLKLDTWEIEHAVEILTKAKDLKELYFKSLPAVKVWVNNTIESAKRGYIYNDFGRAYKFNKNFAFKAPNYVIQGGTADFLKNAMVNMDNFLLPYKSQMLLQVHDEIQFDVVNGEESIVYKLKEIMEHNSRKEYLPYTVGIDHSETSWANKRSYNV